MKSYRDDISKHEVGYIFEDGFKNEDEVIAADDYKDVLDEIEDEVNNIIKLLEPIQGLAEIDDIKDKLAKLADKLY